MAQRRRRMGFFPGGLGDGAAILLGVDGAARIPTAVLATVKVSGGTFSIVPTPGIHTENAASVGMRNPSIATNVAQICSPTRQRPSENPPPLVSATRSFAGR